MSGVLCGAAGGAALGLALAARFTFRAPVLEPGKAVSLASSVPSPVWIGVSVLAGAIAGALLGSRGRERLATPFLLSGLAGAALVPGVFARAPVLAAFSGAFLDLVLGTALAVALGRLAGPRLPSFRLGPNGIALLGFAFFLTLGLHLSRTVGLSGDEPHYLLITESILQDGDIRVQDDYDSEEYRKFYAGRIGTRLAPGTPYPVHGIGVPLLLLPGFALLGLFGVVVTEALFAALLLRAVYVTAESITSSRGAALAAACGFALTSPALFLATSAYPELPAALAVALVAGRLVDRKAPPGPEVAFLWMLALGALPFLHVKFIPLAVILGAAFLHRFSLRWRASLAGFALGASAVVSFSFFTTGSFNPASSYGRQRVFLDGIPLGTAGLLFDQEFGLLLHAPVYLLGLAGIVSLFRRSRALGGLALLVLVSVLLPSAAHPLWSGGTSPPARFLFPALPLLAVGAALLVAREREIGVGRWAPSLLAASIGIALSMLLLPGGPFHLNARRGRGGVFEALSSSWDLTDYLPSLVRADPRSLATACALALLLAVLIAFQIRRFEGRYVPAGILFVGALWLQDLTGVTPSRELEPMWALATMRELAESPSAAYLTIPSFEVLSGRELSARVSLPLEPVRGDGDPGRWWSLSYSLPAGRYRVSGTDEEGAAFRNGDGVFHEGLKLVTNVGLARLQVGARERFGRPRLFLVEGRESGLRAHATIPLSEWVRLHSLQEDLYVDAEGFWVRKSSRASFALERDDGKARAELVLANGGARNRVLVQWAGATEALSLAPWEERRLFFDFDGAVAVLSITSESGFRPIDLDSASGDRRELGVLIRARLSFD